MSTASLFPRGIKASGLAIKVFPGEEKPAGAISLTQQKITHEGARGELELEDSEEAPELYWQPGRLLGPDDQKRAIISHAPTFTSLSNMDPELLSATSRSHTVRYDRPRGVGLGWGEFDRFREWQQFGRQVSKSMVKEQEWQRSNGAIALFRSENEDEMYVIPTSCNEIQSLKRPRRLGSMWKRLNKSTKKEDKKKKREKNATVPALFEKA
ncbi:Ff.00g050100.m01.CDS01 [Fusarium sp. VM40]|nr:Ff.00g050100.m01.CDS01 [Fusarium sp. VM40]